jgi:phospholipid/cholesterol/gamma-HCH transport system substrate-binding protein
VVAGLTLALTASGCGWSGLNANPLPFAAGNGDDALTVTVHLANAVNLVPNSEVKVNDVTVGSVRRIEFDDWQARLTVGLEPDVRLPENTQARIGQKSLLGAEYLELAPPTGERPHGTLADGAVIPLARTGRYPETEELFAALATVLNGGGLAQIDTITSELNDAFNGRESDVRELVVLLGTLMGTLDDQRAEIVAATEGVNDLSRTFADDRETLDAALETMPRAVDILRDERDELTETLDNLAEFGDSTTDLLTANRAQLRRNLASLRPILHELGDAGDALTNFLAGLTFPFPLEGLIKSAKGDYLNLFLTVDATTTAITRDLLGGISPLDSVLSGLTGTQSTATSSGASDPLDLKGSLDKLAKVKPTPPTEASTPPATSPKPGLGGLLSGLTEGLL